MEQTGVVIVDGAVLRPQTPMELGEGQRYRVTLTPLDEQPETAWNVLDALTGTVDAPPDWAVEHDHYLYGTAKPQNRASER